MAHNKRGGRGISSDGKHAPIGICNAVGPQRHIVARARRAKCRRKLQSQVENMYIRRTFRGRGAFRPKFPHVRHSQSPLSAEGPTPANGASVNFVGRSAGTVSLPVAAPREGMGPATPTSSFRASETSCHLTRFRCWQWRVDWSPAVSTAIGPRRKTLR
jgi:hypothetical protein